MQRHITKGKVQHGQRRSLGSLLALSLSCLALTVVAVFLLLPSLTGVTAERPVLREVTTGQADVALQQPRFVDNGDGTVVDRRTGLIWLKHADCFGTRTWEEAQTLAQSASHGLQCPGLELKDNSDPGDWRLPTIREIMTLPMIEFFNPALTNSKGTGKWSEGDPFLGVSSQYYWSSSKVDEENAWYMYLYNGVLGISRITQSYSVWPVKGHIRNLMDVEF